MLVYFQSVEDILSHLNTVIILFSSIYRNFSDAEDDEYKYTEQANMPGTKFDNKKRQTVRNLRIREDTAKVYSLSLLFCLFSILFDVKRDLALTLLVYNLVQSHEVNSFQA